MTSKRALYRQMEVWKKIGTDQMAIYRCLENLSDSKFMVDRVEFFQLPIDKNELSNIVADQMEMFIEEFPEDRLSKHDTLEAAIEAHDIEFENTF